MSRRSVTEAVSCRRSPWQGDPAHVFCSSHRFTLTSDAGQPVRWRSTTRPSRGSCGRPERRSRSRRCWRALCSDAVLRAEAWRQCRKAPVSSVRTPLAHGRILAGASDVRAFSNPSLDHPVGEGHSGGGEFSPVREWPNLAYFHVPSRTEATRPCLTNTAGKPVADARQ